MALVGSLLVASSLALALIAWLAQGRALRRPARRPLRVEGVSVLRPMKGLDPGLEGNLESLFRQDHPRHEILLGFQDEADPAIPVARAVMARHPLVSARIVLSERDACPNPKVANLIGLEREARHDILVVSDSNVRLAPGYLSDLAAHLEDLGVGLVSSPIRASSGRGAGASLEALQLNVFVMGGALAWTEVFGKPCVVGKSMMLRREALRRIGGLQRLGQYLAEDQVCGEEIAATGLRVVMTGRPVDNVLGPIGLRAFLDRHVRWARLRWRLAPLGFLAEPVLNPVAMGALAWPLGAGPAPFGLALAAMSMLSLSAETRLGLAPAWLTMPARELARAACVAAAWPVALAGNTVRWRGQLIRIGRRTLVPARSATPPLGVPPLGVPPGPALEAGGLPSPEWRRV